MNLEEKIYSLIDANDASALNLLLTSLDISVEERDKTCFAVFKKIFLFNQNMPLLNILINNIQHSINDTNEQSRTVLHLAAYHGKFHIVNMLVGHPYIQFSKATLNGCTAVHFALRNKHIDILKCLLQAKASPNCSTHSGSTPLIAATYHGCMDCVKLLLEYKANIDAQNSAGQTALHIAANQNHEEIFNFLVEKGANINIVNMEGLTALDLKNKSSLNINFQSHEKNCNNDSTKLITTTVPKTQIPENKMPFIMNSMALEKETKCQSTGKVIEKVDTSSTRSSQSGNIAPCCTS